MSTKEQVYELVDELSEEQLEGLMILLKGFKKETVNAENVQGILSEYANPDLIPLEEGAWERAAVEKYENS